MQPPMAIPDYKNIEADEYKLTEISGVYDFDSEIKLMNKSYNGKPGFHIMTPLILSPNEKILVNRGWAPVEKEYSKPKGMQLITGVIRRGHEPKWFTIPNDPEKEQWFWLDLDAIYKHANAKPRDFYVQEKIETEFDGYPIPLPKKIKLYNEHVQYIITWFSLSIALLVIYYFRFFKK